MNAKITFGLVLLLIVVVFIVQNATAVDIQFLFWKLSMSRSIMIFFVLVIGFIIGWLSANHYHRRQHQAETKLQ